MCPFGHTRCGLEGKNRRKFDIMAAEKKAEAKKKPTPKKKQATADEKKAARVSVFETLRVLFSSPISSDGWTRRMGFLFFFSLLGVVATARYAKDYFAELRDAAEKDERERISRIHERGEEEHVDEGETNLKIYNKIMADLGAFYMETKPAQGKGYTSMGNLSVAEIHIAVLCEGSAKEATRTCDYIRENMTQAKDSVTTILLPIERELLLSIEGKKQLKRDVLEKLNEWLRSGRHPVGRVKEAYFYHLAAT